MSGDGDDHNTAPELAAEAISTTRLPPKTLAMPPAHAMPFTANGQRTVALVITGAPDGTGANTRSSAVLVQTPCSVLLPSAIPRRHRPLAALPRLLDELVTEINSKTKADGTANPLSGKIRASNDNGKLRIENQSTQKLEHRRRAPRWGRRHLAPALSESLGNSVRAGLADQFNELRDQLDKLADDASFNGINLLRGDKLAHHLQRDRHVVHRHPDQGWRDINSSNLGVVDHPGGSGPGQRRRRSTPNCPSEDRPDEVRSQASSFGSNLRSCRTARPSPPP